MGIHPSFHRVKKDAVKEWRASLKKVRRHLEVKDRMLANLLHDCGMAQHAYRLAVEQVDEVEQGLERAEAAVAADLL